MYKTFTIKAYKCKQVAPGKGHIKYFLEDELGNQRTVSAMAKLGFIKKIKSVHPIHFRESPLIEVLSGAEVNDTIEIDFSDFNKQHPRVASNERNSLNTNAYQELKENDSEILSTLSFDPFRILQLFVIALVGLALLIGIKSLF